MKSKQQKNSKKLKSQMQILSGLETPFAQSMSWKSSNGVSILFFIVLEIKNLG